MRQDSAFRTQMLAQGASEMARLRAGSESFENAAGITAPPLPKLPLASADHNSGSTVLREPLYGCT